MVNMGTKFFSLKKGERSKPDDSFATLPSKRPARKQLDPSIFNDTSINQEYFLDQHGSVSVIGFRNPDKELVSKTPMTNFLPAVGTYSSKVTPRIDPIPLKSSSTQNLVEGYHNSSHNSPIYASKSSINIMAPRDSYYRENTRRSMKNSPYSSPYRNRSIISTGASSVTHYFSYENLNSSTEKNINTSAKPDISLNFDTSNLDGSQIFDSFYNTQAIHDAERALTRNSKYPNGRPTSQRLRNSGSSQYKYRTTINLENLEDIMRLSRDSIKKSSMQKALNDENMASQDNSQLTLTSTRKSNSKTSGKTVDPNNLEVPTTLQELPEEHSDSDSFYDPLPILSRPGSDLDQSNSLTSPSERNEDTSASSSHDLYEGSNNVNLESRTHKCVSIRADNTIDFNITSSDFNSIREGDTTLNSSGVLELGPNISLNDSSILGSSQNNQHHVHNNSLNFSDQNPSQSVNFTTQPPMPPPKPKSFFSNSPFHSKSNLTSGNISLLNIQTTSETGGPLTAPPRPRIHTNSSDNLKDKQDLSPQSPDQVPEKPSFYLASNPSGKLKFNITHSTSNSQDSNTGSFPENDFSLGISNSTADESGLSLPSFLNDIINSESSQDGEAINRDLELDNSEVYDPFKLKKQIFEESELPEQVAKAESICNPSSVINHRVESESASISCSESFDLNSPVFEEPVLLPKSPKLESVTDRLAEAVNGLETSPVDSRDIFNHSRIALDESDLIPESFENSNNARIDPITNSPLTIDAYKSESSSPNFNSLAKTNALISNFPKPVDELDKSKETIRASNLSGEVKFRIEKPDENHLNDSRVEKFMNFPLPDPLAKEPYLKTPTIGIRIESESSLRQSRELANSKLDADNTSQKSKKSGRRYKFPEPIIPPPVNFSPVLSGNSLLSPISKTRFHEDDIESGSDTTPQQNSFAISSKHDTTPKLRPMRSLGLAFSSGNSSTSVASNIPPKTPKSATFGNHVEYDESILSIDDHDMYEKVRKLEEDCIRYRDEIESQAYLLNETAKLMIEERENKVCAEYEMRKIKKQLEEANSSLEQANASLEQANASLEQANVSLEEQGIRIKSLEEANSSLELTNKSLEEQSMRMKSLEEANISLEEKSKKMAATELELEEAKSELYELKKINEEISIQLESSSELQLALDDAKSTIFQLEMDTKNNESILIEKDDRLTKLEKDHIQLKSNFNSISQDLEDLRRINQQEWLNSSRNSSFMNKPRTSKTGSSSSSEGKSKYAYSNRRSDTLSSNGDISKSIIFEESLDEINERSFQFTRDSTDTIIAARRLCSMSNNNSEIDINPPSDSNNYYDEYQKCNERVKKLLKQIEGRDKQIAELNELIKSQSNAKSSALNNYNKLASRSMSQLNTSRLSNSSSSSGKSNRSNIFESATLTIQKLQSQLNGADNGDNISPRKLYTNTSFNEPFLMSPTLFSPTFKQFTNTEAERSFTNDMLNHLPVSFKLNDIKYREFIEFTGSELKERADTDFVKRVMAEDIEYLISCDPNLNNWRTHKQILQALQNSELTLIDSKTNNNNDHFTISDLVQQSKTHDRSLSSSKINNTCELCGNHPHHTVTPQYYYKVQLQSDPNPICSACFHRLGTAQKFFKFLSQGINRSNAGFQPHKLYFEVLQLKLDMFLARNGINTPNEIENELIRSHLLWRTND